jgi:putative sigma-54 modulation protein
MQIIISSRNCSVSDALKAQIEEKLNAVLDRPNLKITSARVMLEVEKERNIVEISVSLKNHQFDAKAETKVMFESIDSAIGKIDTQIERLVDRVQDHGNKKPLRDVITEEPAESADE